MTIYVQTSQIFHGRWDFPGYTTVLLSKHLIKIKFQENLNKLNNAKVADKNTHLESFKHELNKADDSVTTIKNRIKSCPPDSITDPNCKSITSPFKALSKYSTYCHLY